MEFGEVPRPIANYFDSKGNLGRVKRAAKFLLCSPDQLSQRTSQTNLANAKSRQKASVISRARHYRERLPPFVLPNTKGIILFHNEQVFESSEIEVILYCSLFP